MPIVEAQVPHNRPLHIKAEVTQAQNPVLSLLYKNQANPAEDGWIDREVPVISRHMVFDEIGFHDLFFSAVSLDAGQAARLKVELTEITGAVIVSFEQPFQGPAAALQLDLASF